MVIVAQLVRASDCGSEGRGFETRLSPRNAKLRGNSRLFLWVIVLIISLRGVLFSRKAAKTQTL